MIKPTKGFFLFEAVFSLALIIFTSSLILSWQVSRIKRYRELKQQIQGLSIARSIIEQILLRQIPQYPQEFWSVSIKQQRDPLLPLIYLTVSLFDTNDNKPPLILKTATNIYD
jgi:hypothetical protein